MSLRVSRASSVIIHRVPPAVADRFLELQEGFSRAAETFPGYQGSDVYPPGDAASIEWVVVVHFADDAALQQWLASPVREEVVGQVRREIGDFEIKTSRAGFGSWFTRGETAPDSELPAGWKMALTVLLALYPTVMLLSLTVGRVLSPLGMAISMLIGNALSISILQWGLMPFLTRVLSPWLQANARSTTVTRWSGLAIIAVLLTVLTLIFHQIAG